MTIKSAGRRCRCCTMCRTPTPARPEACWQGLIVASEGRAGTAERARRLLQRPARPAIGVERLGARGARPVSSDAAELVVANSALAVRVWPGRRREVHVLRRRHGWAPGRAELLTSCAVGIPTRPHMMHQELLHLRLGKGRHQRARRRARGAALVPALGWDRPWVAAEIGRDLGMRGVARPPCGHRGRGSGWCTCAGPSGRKR